MTDPTHRAPGDDADRERDAEIEALRAELRANDLLPGLPAAFEPTAASAEAMLQRVLASQAPAVAGPTDDAAPALDPAVDPAVDPAPALDLPLVEDSLAAARRRRATLTRTLFGLAATVLVAAVVVVPLASQPRPEGAADAEATAHGAVEGVQPMMEGGGGLDPHGLDPRSLDPRSLDGLDVPAELLPLPPLVGTVVDVDGCLAVRQDETGTVYIPLDSPDAPVREHLVEGTRVSITAIEHPDLHEDLAVPEACDPAGPFWPAASIDVLP